MSVGELNVNKYNNKMKIIHQNGTKDVIVLFVDFGVKVHTQYVHFLSGEVKCPFDKRYFKVGYKGVGEHLMSVNGKDTFEATKWRQMLTRCYDESYKLKHPTYKDVSCDEDWLNFQNFAQWSKENYYEVSTGEEMHLDKDLLCKNNLIYSSEKCIYVPKRINVLFADRSEPTFLPKGVRVRGKKFAGYMNGKYLGIKDTPEEAFILYKKAKEQFIKEVAESYKTEIPKELYEAMCNWVIEIND